jgi:hypothetical protein
MPKAPTPKLFRPTNRKAVDKFLKAYRQTISPESIFDSVKPPAKRKPRKRKKQRKR